MAIRPIVEVPDPRLRQISSPVEEVTDDVRALVADMFETMYDAPGIGLAAIQVGVPKRILVIDLQEPKEEGGEPVKDPRVFINPEILTTSDEDVPYTEANCFVPWENGTRTVSGIPKAKAIRRFSDVSILT